MPPIRLRARQLVPLLLTWTLIATAPAAVTAQSPGVLPSGSPGPSAAGSATQIAEALGTAVEDPATVAAGEAERRQAERIGLGVAEIDPELPAIMDELDAIAAGALAGYLAEITAPAPEPSPEPDASPGQGVRARASALLQDGLLLTWGMASSAAEQFVGAWRPAPGSATLPGRPFSSSGSFDKGGRFTAYRMSLTDSVSVQDGTIRLAYVFEMHSEVIDSATNATVASIDDRGSYAITINPCPREGGIVDTTTEAESNLTIRRPGGGTSAVSERATATAVTTVTDDAEIGRTVTDVVARRTTSGGASSDVGFTARFGEGGTPSATITHDDGSEADLQATARGAAAAAALGSVDRVVGKAREVWRARCLTVTATPAGREVVPGSETSISATVRHAVEDREINVPVRATLVGTASITPNDEPRDTPAEITYRAGLEPRAEATITFRTTSARGRAERSETYRTLPRFLLDIEGDVDASLGQGKSTFSVSGRALKVSFGPGDPPAVRVRGRVQIRGRTSDPTGCRSTYSGSIPVSEDASARLIVDGTTVRLAVLLTPGDQTATVRVRARCPGGATTTNFPAVMLLGVWALGRDAAIVDLPNGSATVHVARSGPTPKQTWTVTVRPDS